MPSTPGISFQDKNQELDKNISAALGVQNLDCGQEKVNTGRSLGLSLAAIFGFTGLATIIVAFPFIKPGFRKICLPYVPASEVQVSNVLQALKGFEGKVIDLGSGDGRLVSKIG